MVDIKVPQNSKGLTYELINYAKSVNNGNVPILNAEKWERIMKIIVEINNKRPSDKAIFSGNNNLFGKTSENFVIKDNTIHFSDEEIALILKEMGIKPKPNSNNQEFSESFNIKGLTVEHIGPDTTPPYRENVKTMPQNTNNTAASQNTSGNTAAGTNNSNLEAPSQNASAPKRFLAFGPEFQAKAKEFAEQKEKRMVKSARDTINMAPPFEITPPVTGAKGGGTKTVSEAFHRKMLEISEKIGCTYEDLITIMNFESGINPSEGKGKTSKPVGLIQFTTSSIKALNRTYGLNLTKESVVRMSGIKQLDLVEKYFLMTKQGNARLRTKEKLDAADLYSLTLLPNRAGREILCKKNERNKNGKLLGYYESNRALDLSNDNMITRQDILKKLNEYRINIKVV